jgi:alternate signal-mediated exported protein, RER_14450 family
MNKLTKGAIAGAAGIALLLGGAGSFALWNGSASAAAGTVNAGTLSVAANGTGSWANTPNGGTSGAITIGTFKAVPGDTLTFTQKLNVASIGDNLNATLTVDPTSIVVPTPDATGANAALKAALIAGMKVAITGASNIAQVGTTNSYTVTNAAAVQTVTAVVTLPFPRGTAGDNTTQAGSVDLSALSFTLNQN